MHLDPVCGITVRQALRKGNIPPALDGSLIVRLNDQTIFDWDHIICQRGDRLDLYAAPEGGDQGKSILGSVAMIALTVASGGIATAVTQATSGLLFAGVRAGISLVGTLMISALIGPPKTPALTGAGGAQSRPAAEEQTRFITGQSNEVRLFRRVPRLYGRHRYVPPLAATPQIQNTGTTSRVAVLYDFGLGDIDLGDIRVGDLPINVVDPEIRIYKNRKDIDLDFLSRPTAYDQLDYALVKDTPLVITTKPDAIRASVDLAFPGGLVRFDQNGERHLHSVGMRVRYRLQGSSTWQTMPARWYAGAIRNTENLVFKARYDVGDVADFDTYGTVWMAKSKHNGENELQIWRSGRLIYSDVRKDDYNLITELDVDARTLRRGVSRGSFTEPDGDTRLLYEVLVGEAQDDRETFLSSDTASAFVVNANLRFDEPGVHEIQITRTTEVADPTVTNTLRDEVRVGTIRSFRRGRVIDLAKRHTMVEVSYTATDRVSGVVQDFNAIGTSRLKWFNQNGWTGERRATANPAVIAVDLLTGPSARYPLRDDEIHWDSFAELKQICEQDKVEIVNGLVLRRKLYEFNGIIEDDLTLGDALRSVLSVARADIKMMPNGKYGVLIDKAGLEVRQLITPRNSWDFSLTRPFAPMPDALRVSYLDETLDWEPADILVFRDGKNMRNSETIEDLRTWGITNASEARAYGRYMLGQGILRSETFTWNMGIDNLVVAKGDRVKVQHDVPAFGGLSFRVVEVNGSQITLDAPIDLSAGSYVVRRRADGEVRSGQVTGQKDERTIVVSSPVHFDEGALVALDSTTSSAAEDYIITSIEPEDDFTARLSAVRYDEQLYKTDSGELPTWDPNFGEDLTEFSSVEIGWGSIDLDWVFEERTPWLEARLKWEVLEGAGTYAGARIDVKLGNEPWELIGTVFDARRKFVAKIHWADREWFVGAAKFRVRPFNVLGVHTDAIRRTKSLPMFNKRPKPPRNFSTDIRGEEVTLTWRPSKSPFVTHYVCRYTKELDNPKWSRSTSVGRASWDQTSLTVPARTGTYLIAAVGVTGRRSEAVMARSTVVDLPDINVIKVLDEAPTWPGKKIMLDKGRVNAWSYAQVHMQDGSLATVAVPVGWANRIRMLDGSTIKVLEDVDIPDTVLVSPTNWEDLGDDAKAIYYCDEIVDLGAICEVRVQSKIVAMAIDTGDFQVNLPEANPDLSEAEPEFERDIDWTAWIEYRSVDQVSYMASWPDLSSLATLSQGSAPWSNWRPVAASGLVTGRILQFRICLQADRNGMMVLLEGGEIEIDARDRVIRMNNISVPVGGTRINFPVPFAPSCKPVVSVGIEGSTTAVGSKVTNVDHLGFNVTLVNSGGNAVAGQSDIGALGFGKIRQGSI